MTDSRRWYDKDPFLKEALDLLKLSSEEEKGEAAKYILKLQDQVAADVIEDLYDTIKNYNNNGNRWYDKDPVMMKAVELLRKAPPSIQRKAAKKLIESLSSNDYDYI